MPAPPYSTVDGGPCRPPRATAPNSATISNRLPIRAPGCSARPADAAVCIEKLRYIGQADLKRDLDNFKAATAGAKVAEAYLPANTPGTIEHWMANEHYKNDEEFVFAIADAMHEEYQAIVDAGFQLQIDDPDLPDGWNCLPGMSVAATIANTRCCASMRSTTRSRAFRKRKCGCMCAGAASTARITTTFR